MGRGRGPVDLPANKDCSQPIAQVGDDFAVQHKTHVLKKKHTSDGGIDRTAIDPPCEIEVARERECRSRASTSVPSVELFVKPPAGEPSSRPPAPGEPEQR